MKPLNILIACEESGAVRDAFIALGHNAISCDIQPSSSDNDNPHIMGDALAEAYSGKYDMMIAFPPCTYLSKAGARWMYPTAGNVCPKRYAKSQDAKEFFLKLLEAPIPYIAIENPTPLKVCGLPKNTQVIQPYQFGHQYSKRTLLWLKGLPSLTPTDIVTQYTPFLPSNTSGFAKGQGGSRGVAHNAKDASKTFKGIASAMAQQWSDFLSTTNLPTE